MAKMKSCENCGNYCVEAKKRIDYGMVTATLEYTSDEEIYRKLNRNMMIVIALNIVTILVTVIMSIING
jgi:hypothetical protein